jgi:hypothetical protein
VSELLRHRVPLIVARNAALVIAQQDDTIRMLAAARRWGLRAVVGSSSVFAFGVIRRAIELQRKPRRDQNVNRIAGAVRPAASEQVSDVGARDSFMLAATPSARGRRRT